MAKKTPIPKVPASKKITKRDPAASLKRRKNETPAIFRNRKARKRGFTNYYEERIVLKFRRDGATTLQDARGKAGPGSSEKPVSKPRAKPPKVRARTEKTVIGSYPRTVYDFGRLPDRAARRALVTGAIAAAVRRRGDSAQFYAVHFGTSPFYVNAPPQFYSSGWSYASGGELLAYFDLIEGKAKDPESGYGRMVTIYIAQTPK